MLKSLKPNALIWPLVVLIIAAGAMLVRPWQAKPLETITVTAEGKTQVVPNVAKITTTIETQNQNLDTARAQNQQKVATFVDKLKALGVDEKDIKTENIAAGPRYEIQIYPGPKPIGNAVSTSLEITIRDFSKTDAIIATLTQNGAANLYGPNLTVDDTTLDSAKSKARENAVNNARQKAQELAKLSNRKLGKVITIKEQGDFGVPQPMLAIGGMDLKEKVAQIQPGQNTVTINLSVDFSLK